MAGSNSAMSTPIIAMTTNSSTRVNAMRLRCIADNPCSREMNDLARVTRKRKHVLVDKDPMRVRHDSVSFGLLDRVHVSWKAAPTPSFALFASLNRTEAPEVECRPHN